MDYNLIKMEKIKITNFKDLSKSIAVIDTNGTTSVLSIEIIEKRVIPNPRLPEIPNLWFVE